MTGKPDPIATAASPREISPAIPQGVQTFLPADAERRSVLTDRLFAVLKGWSYREVVLPLYDFFEVFAEGSGPALVDKTLRFVDSQGKVVALRSDFTPLVAKLVATRLAHVSGPLRLCYRGDVVRLEPPRAGAQADFGQVGAELIGVNGLAGDIEILAVAADALDAAGVGEFVIAVAHAGVFQALVDEAKLPRDAVEAIKRAVDRKDPVALDAALARSGTAIPPWVAAALRSLPARVGGPAEVDRAASELPLPRVHAALDGLRDLVLAYRSAGLPGRVVVDLGEVRGVDYYTGMKFNVYAAGLGVPLGGGGRYDTLLGRFGLERAAVGFSLSVDRVLHHLASNGRGDVPSGPAAEIPLPADPQGLAAAVERAREERRAGKQVALGGLPHPQPPARGVGGEGAAR